MKAKKVIATVLGASMLLGAAACSDGSGKGVKVKFLYTGTNVLMEQMKTLIDTYNDGQGKTDGIEIIPTPVVDSGYEGSVNNLVRSKNGPDIYMTRDEYYKVYTKYFYNWNEYSNINTVLDNTYNSLAYRMRYDQAEMTSNDDDPLYALPFYNNVSALFYNKTAMTQMGVTCISVPEDKLDEFNAGTYTDGNGKKKGDYGISETVYNRGFFRYDGKNYVGDLSNPAGTTWQIPAAGTRMIFNDQIPMNFDEVEDLGLYMTKSRNGASLTEYGYYTEWWFNYGWSVGGDCMEDISGSGDFRYTLGDESKNYIVNEGKTYQGAYTGKTYAAGETLEWLDKMEVAQGQTVTANANNTFSVGGSVIGNRAALASKVTDGTLTELPSIKEVFSRFAYLSGANGINVCPTPNSMSVSSISYFYSTKVAMIIERLDYAQSVTENLKKENKEWGVAHCPVYRKYADPQNGASAIEKEGKTATHSLGYGLTIKNDSKVISQSQTVINWLLTEGQKIMAENGYLPANKQYEEAFKTNAVAKNTIPNPSVALQIHQMSQAGDWWYMPDRTWIDGWANGLNTGVRNGSMTLENFFKDYTTSTNTSLKAYKD